MKLNLLLLSLLLLALVGCGVKTESIHLADSPIEFKLQKSTTPDVYATYEGGTVSTSQILDQNPVFLDLKNQENLIRIEHILRKFASDGAASGSTALNIFLPAPQKNVMELAKNWGITLNSKTKINFKDTAPDKDVIAQWGDQQIQTTDVDVASVRLALVRTRAYKENLNRLKGILVRRALLQAAQAENMEIEEYIKKNIKPDESPVSDSEFEKFLAASNIKKQDIDAKQEEALRKIAAEKRKNNVVENYVAKKLLKGTVIVHEFPPTFNVQLPEAWQSVWGLDEAPVSVNYFGDFVCGPCRDALKKVLDAKESFKGNVKVGFNFLFSRSDRDSRMLSEAALCVHSQGEKHFRKFAEIYANNPPGIDESALESAAKNSGADVEAYKKCFLARDHQNVLNQQLDFASKAGVTSMPTVIIDGEPLEGSMSAEDVRAIIQRKVNTKTTLAGSLWRKIKSIFVD